MRIENVRLERTEGRCRALAEIIWEDRDCPPRTLAIETEDLHANDLTASPDGLLVAVLPLAQWMSERRVRVEGRICPRLRSGLAAAMELFAGAYGCAPVRIEPTQGFEPTRALREPRTASFLSGGVDALALLRANRLQYPSDHPRFVRDCIVLFGLNTHDYGADGPVAERRAAFEAHATRLSAFAERTGAALIPISTNVRSLYPDFLAWTHVGFGAGTISTALCLGARIDRILFASPGLGVRLPMHGSHPCLDHHFSTEAVTVHHAEPAMTRLEKTRLIAEWEDALAVLRSCVYATLPTDSRINCGECEKCIRTMLALVALGRLDRAPTFPFDDVRPAMVAAMRIESPTGAMFLAECVEALEVRGRPDLARAVRRRLDAWRRDQRRGRLMRMLRGLPGR